MGTVLELVASISVIFINNYKVLLYTFNSLFAFGAGLNHLTCLQILWEHYMRNRGEIVGFVFFSSWFGNYMVKNICYLIANPEQKPLTFVPELKQEIFEPADKEDMRELISRFFIFFLSLFTIFGLKIINRAPRRVQINLEMLYSVSTESDLNFSGK